jgi:protein TonB
VPVRARPEEAGVTRSPLKITVQILSLGALIAIPLVAPAILPAPPALEAPTRDAPERLVPSAQQRPAIENSGAAPVRPGGNVRPPTKTKDVKPIYPLAAQTANIEGSVTLEATIGPNGKVQDAKVLSSHPLLEAAALDAVRQWEFTPTLLNGSPVSVVMTITVDFKLP